MLIIRALRTGGPEMLREEYDTLVSEDYARGEAWTENVRAAEQEISALTGVPVDQLEPGMALIGISPRKRQWNGSGVLRDWARGVTAG